MSHHTASRHEHDQNQNHKHEHSRQRAEDHEVINATDAHISIPTTLTLVSPASPTLLAATASTSTSTSKLRPRPSRRKADALRKVLGSWGLSLGHQRHSDGDNAVPIPVPATATAAAGAGEAGRAASLDDDGNRRRAAYQITHWPDRPSGSGSRSGGALLSSLSSSAPAGTDLTDEEIGQRLSDIWRRNARERELRRSGSVAMQRSERERRLGVDSTSTAGSWNHNHNNHSHNHNHNNPSHGADDRPLPLMITKSKPRTPNPGSGDAVVPPLALRTRNLSTSAGSSGNVNYCYPLGSPRSNRENPFARPPGGTTSRRQRQDDDGYSSDGSTSPVSPGAVTIDVYRSASLLRQDRGGGDGDGTDTVGRGRSARGKKPTAPRLPSHVKAAKYSGANNNGTKSPLAATAAAAAITGPRRAPSTKGKDGRSGRVSKAMAHRRRQTRYAGRPSVRGSSPTSVYHTSVYYNPANIRQALSTPSLFTSWAIGATGTGEALRRDAEREPRPPTPPPLDRSVLFPAGGAPSLGTQRCFMVGCASGKPALPGSGLCEDCADEFRPRESTFFDRTRTPSRSHSFSDLQPMIDPAEFDAMFGPMLTAHLQEQEQERERGPGHEQASDEQQQQHGEVDTPADKVASKFNLKFNSTRSDAEFRLQPAPKGKGPASKHDSIKSTGSDKSHVGFQMAASAPSKTPEPELGPERGRQSSEQADEYPDHGSATSEDAWESRSWRDDSPALSGTDSPSLRHGRGKPRSWDSGTASADSQIDDVIGLIRDHGEETVYEFGKDSMYDDINEIIELYRDINKVGVADELLRKPCAVASVLEAVTNPDETDKPREQGKPDVTVSPRGDSERGRAAKRARGDARGLREMHTHLRDEVGGRDEDGPPVGNWI